MIERKIKALIVSLGAVGLIGCAPPSVDHNGEPDLTLDLEPYGCEIKDDFQKNSEGDYGGRINARYGLHKTGIIVNNNDSIDVTATGEACWYPDACNGPEGIASKTWGLYGYFRRTGLNVQDGIGSTFKIGSHYASKIVFSDGTSRELILFIPDGVSNDYCLDFEYQDNSGYFSANVKKTW